MGIRLSPRQREVLLGSFRWSGIDRSDFVIARRLETMGLLKITHTEVLEHNCEDVEIMWVYATEAGLDWLDDHYDENANYLGRNSRRTKRVQS